MAHFKRRKLRQINNWHRVGKRRTHKRIRTDGGPLHEPWGNSRMHPEKSHFKKGLR